jgi:hypothetical protein
MLLTWNKYLKSVSIPTDCSLKLGMAYIIAPSMYCLHHKGSYFDIHVLCDPYKGGLLSLFSPKAFPPLVYSPLLRSMLLHQPPTPLLLVLLTFPFILLCYYFHITRFLPSQTSLLVYSTYTIILYGSVVIITQDGKIFQTSVPNDNYVWVMPCNSI